MMKPRPSTNHLGAAPGTAAGSRFTGPLPQFNRDVRGFAVMSTTAASREDRFLDRERCGAVGRRARRPPATGPNTKALIGWHRTRTRAAYNDGSVARGSRLRAAPVRGHADRVGPLCAARAESGAYARCGAFSVVTGSEATRVVEKPGLARSRRLRARARGAGAAALRYELIRGAVPSASPPRDASSPRARDRPDPRAEYLMRADRSTSRPAVSRCRTATGAAASAVSSRTLTHRGRRAPGGSRRAARGRERREPVLAVASKDEPTSFIRWPSSRASSAAARRSCT